MLCSLLLMLWPRLKTFLCKEHFPGTHVHCTLSRSGGSPAAVTGCFQHSPPSVLALSPRPPLCACVTFWLIMEWLRCFSSVLHWKHKMLVELLCLYLHLCIDLLGGLYIPKALYAFFFKELMPRDSWKGKKFTLRASQILLHSRCACFPRHQAIPMLPACS